MPHSTWRTALRFTAWWMARWKKLGSRAVHQR